MGITVNFNNLRAQTIYAYDKLCEKLNLSMIEDDAIGDFVAGFGTLHKGDIIVSAEYIQKEMDSLRMLIGSIAMTYEPGDDDFKDVYSEIFPENESNRMKLFNEIDEDAD